MEMITERRRLLALQHQLNKRLTELMPKSVERKALIPSLTKKVTVNYNSQLMKWFFFLDNEKDQKFTFYFGNWKFGGEHLPYNGSINISWIGDDPNAGIFALKDDKVYLLHSGFMGAKAPDNFFDKYDGEFTTDVEGVEKKYAIVGAMKDEDIAEKVVRFFDFLAT